MLKKHEARRRPRDLARTPVSRERHRTTEGQVPATWMSPRLNTKQLDGGEREVKKLFAEQMSDAAALRELLSENRRPPSSAKPVALFQALMGLSNPRLFNRQHRSRDDPLSIMPTATQNFRLICTISPTNKIASLSAIVHPAAPGRQTVRDQPHLPALPRRGPDGAQAAVAAARSGNTAANRRRGGRQRPLISGFRP